MTEDRQRHSERDHKGSRKLNDTGWWCVSKQIVWLGSLHTRGPRFRSAVSQMRTCQNKIKCLGTKCWEEILFMVVSSRVISAATVRLTTALLHRDIEICYVYSISCAKVVRRETYRRFTLEQARICSWSQVFRRKISFTSKVDDDVHL